MAKKLLNQSAQNLAFFRTDDNDEVINGKKVLLLYAAACIVACLGYIFVSSVPRLATAEQDDDPDNPPIRHVFIISASASVVIVLVCGLIYMYKVGLSIAVKVVLILGPCCAGIVWWILSYDSSFIYLSIIPIDLAIALTPSREKGPMDCLAHVLVLVFLVVTTLDCLDLEQDLGIHVYGRRPQGAAYKWCTFVFPIVLNFFLMRSYVKSVHDQEQHATRSVEMVYKIADLLANYDLVAAENLLNSEFRSGRAERINEPLRRLCNNLRGYMTFLPQSLFAGAETSAEIGPDFPNEELSSAMSGKKASLDRVHYAVNRMLDLDYTIHHFHSDMVDAYPELDLYNFKTKEENTTSGRTASEEYERTLGALYAVYSLLRLDLDGKEVFSYGVDKDGVAIKVPTGAEAVKKQKFFELMDWKCVSSLLVRAEVLEPDGKGLRKDRVVALLTLTAIHDIMKNASLLPYVSSSHSPFRGYFKGEQIGDHDIALEYLLEHYPWVLPAVRNLEPGQRAPILFSQGKMGFNNGWLVQGEAPPGALFSRFKKVIMEGRASRADINFYFLHWLTDLAGAEPFGGRDWPGAEKFSLKFPVKVLSEFLKSFSFVDRLANASEVQTMEDYLVERWTGFGFDISAFPSQSDIALMRLSLMAQGFERAAVDAFRELPADDRAVLSEEMARTGCKENFRRSPASVRSKLAGPALLVYYAPALVQKAGADHCGEALRVLAAVFRAARILFPLDEGNTETTVIIRIDALKSLMPTEIWTTSPWHLRRTSSTDAEAALGDAPDENSVTVRLVFLHLF